MPEGDTVWRAARSLERELTGKTLLSTDFRVPRYALSDLSGGEVLSTVSRGKHLLTRIAHETGDWTIHSHLKMEGVWRTFRPGASWRLPEYQARIVLTTDDRVAVGFSLGILDLIPTAAEQDAVGHLGPDLLGPDWDEDEALRRLRTDPSVPIGQALLEQRNLAGVGNVFQSELCFVSGLDPRRPVDTVERLPRVVRLAHLMLDQNKERSTRTTTGDLRKPLWVYGRVGSPCRRCSTKIVVEELGPVGRERLTYWCPRCQPPLSGV